MVDLDLDSLVQQARSAGGPGPLAARGHGLEENSQQTLGFWDACQNFLHEKTDLVVLTNHAISSQHINTYYLFKIERHALTLMNFYNGSKHEFVYVKETDTLTLDGQTQPKDALQGFVTQLNRIGRDLSRKRTFMFEAPLEGD